MRALLAPLERPSGCLSAMFLAPRRAAEPPHSAATRVVLPVPCEPLRFPLAFRFFLFYRHSWLWKCGDAAGGLSPQTLGQVLWVKCLWDRGRGGGCGAYRNCGTLLGCHRHRWCGEEPGEAALNQVSAEGAVRSIQKRVQNQPCFKDRSNAWCSLVKELV